MNPIIKRIVSVLLAFVFAVGIIPVDKPLEANAAEETISDIYSGWYWPLTQSYTSLSSGFGYRASMGDYHQGIDIQRCEGQPIYAARKGTVVAVTYQASMGNYVSIRHGTYNGATIYTTYMHMKYTGCVSVGQDVDQTTVIGYVGATGEVTGPHLHFQICKNGINPAHNNNSDLNANYFNPSNITYSYDHTTPSPQTAPTNAWVTASATTVKVGEPVTFTYGAQGAYSQAFNYYINGSLTTIFIGFGTQQYTYTFNSPGTYITHITNYNNYGLTDSQDIVIYVYNSTPTNAWAEASATTVQVGEPVTFTYGAQGAISYAFNYFINGNLTVIDVGYATQYTYTFNSPGTYITHITNYNNYGLTDSQDIVIFVYDPNTIYTVTFDPNGGSNAPASQTKTYGQTMTLSAGIPTRMGYTFTVWNTKADGTGTSYAPGAAYTADENITLYAQWKKVEVMLQSIAVKTDPTKTTYIVGDTLNTAGLTLTATYSDNSTKTITSGFTCSPTKLDTAGFRTITVTYGGKTTTFGVTVNNPAPTQGRVKSVSVNDVSINYKSSTTLKPTVTADEGVKYSVKYESSNPNAVSVDNNGNVKGLKKGSATITCTLTDQYGNTVKDTCKVTVSYSVWQWIIIILLFGWIWY